MESPYSNDQRDFTIEPGCPWYESQQSYGAPNVNWCEPTTCAYINEPANTWSNLSYILLGLVLVKKLKKSPGNAFPWAVIAMGLLSALYHATNNYLTQFFDFVGMFLMMSFLLAFNFSRLFQFRVSFSAFFWFFMFLNTCIFMTFDIIDQPVQKIILFNAAPLILLELFNGIREGVLRHYRYLVLGILLLAAAQAAAIVDIRRIYCEPENLWLHGHVIWHLLGGVGMYCIGLHLKEIQSLSLSGIK